MGDAIENNALRYASGGELHRDFPASILDGANYVRDNFGEEALREVVFETGTKVYRTIHEKLVAGDKSELLAWWRYYMDREGAAYTLEETVDGAVLTVKDCPALRHLENRGIDGGKGFARSPAFSTRHSARALPMRFSLKKPAGVPAASA
jgi:hypothetical protein